MWSDGAMLISRKPAPLTNSWVGVGVQAWPGAPAGLRSRSLRQANSWPARQPQRRARHERGRAERQRGHAERLQGDAAEQRESRAGEAAEQVVEPDQPAALGRQRAVRELSGRGNEREVPAE